MSVRDKAGSKIGEYSNGTLRDNTGSKIGEISNGTVRDKTGSKIGEFSGQTVRDKTGSKVGEIQSSGAIRDKTGSKIGGKLQWDCERQHWVQNWRSPNQRFGEGSASSSVLFLQNVLSIAQAIKVNWFQSFNLSNFLI